MTTLQLCPSCARHLQARESRCPFCGSRVARSPVLAAAVVGVALAAQACKDDPAPLPAYGIPPIETDAGAPDAGGTDAGS